MSLVADVIACAKEHKMTNPTPEMEALIEQSETAKVQVCEALNSHYKAMTFVFNETAFMHNTISKCLEDISSLDSRIKEKIIPSVEGSASEIGSISVKWKEIKEELNIVQMLLSIHSNLNDFEASLQSNKFEAAIENLSQVEDILYEASKCDLENHFEILSILRDELCSKREEITIIFGEVWNKFVTFTEGEVEGEEKISLNIREIEGDENGEAEKMRQIISALNEMEELRRFIRSFGQNLKEHFVKPILCDCKQLTIFRQGESKVSTISLADSSYNPASKNSTTALNSLHWLRLLFDFLNENFSKFSLEDSTKPVSLMSMLGAEIGEEFINLILSNCLEDSVPLDRKDLKSFNEVQTKVEEFHDFLVQIGFHSKDHNSLLNFASNLDVVYGNKTCVNLLTKTRMLMLKPLDVTETVGPSSLAGEMLKNDPELEEGGPLSGAQKLSTKSFQLPKCQVSTSVIEFVKVLYETLNEACHSTPEFATRLYHTVRNMLSVYWHITPTIHAHALSASPKYAALVHNNGVYVAHHTFLFVHLYKSKLLKSSENSTLSTADIGYMIRDSGCNAFLKAMQDSKTQLLQRIRKGAESFSWKSETTSANPFQVSIEECLDDLKELQAAWLDILPSSVFSKSIGTLANSLVEDVLLRITNLEEISTDDAIGLIQALSLLTSSVPSLFEGGGEGSSSSAKVLVEVRLWEKLKELVIVLGASLKDLDERWAGGKGPLAHHFTPGEVKHLVRAIFQNTERRAQLLAKIK